MIDVAALAAELLDESFGEMRREEGDPEAQAALDARTAHLQGQHDQKSHGRRGPGGLHGADEPDIDVAFNLRREAKKRVGTRGDREAEWGKTEAEVQARLAESFPNAEVTVRDGTMADAKLRDATTGIAQGLEDMARKEPEVAASLDTVVLGGDGFGPPGAMTAWDMSLSVSPYAVDYQVQRALDDAGVRVNRGAYGYGQAVHEMSHAMTVVATVNARLATKDDAYATEGVGYRHRPDTFDAMGGGSQNARLRLSPEPAKVSEYARSGGWGEREAEALTYAELNPTGARPDTVDFVDWVRARTSPRVRRAEDGTVLGAAQPSEGIVDMGGPGSIAWEWAIEVEAETAHLRGRHDQKSHGRRGGAPTTEVDFGTAHAAALDTLTAAFPNAKVTVELGEDATADDIARATGVADGLAEMSTEYPKVGEDIARVKLAPGPLYGSYNSDGTVYINYGEQPEVDIQTVPREGASPYDVGRAVGIHEMGHAVDLYAQQRIILDDPRRQGDAAKRMFNEWGADEAYRSQTTVPGWDWEGGTAGMPKRVSEYAATSGYEWFAENFVAAKTGFAEPDLEFPGLLAQIDKKYARRAAAELEPEQTGVPRKPIEDDFVGSIVWGVGSRTAHLQGRHDQKSHGRRGGGGGQQAAYDLLAENDAETPEQVRAALDTLGAEEVNWSEHGSTQGSVYVIDSPSGEREVVEWDGTDGYTEVTNAYDWVGQQDPSDFFPNYDQEWNDSFWESGPSTIFHATTEDHVEGILADGLESRGETRGVSNRWEGPAVYTSPNDSVLEAYGDAVIAIDLDAMRRDGVTPFAAQEPDVADYELSGALAWSLGVEDWEGEIESGMDPETVVLYGDIPAKYLSRQAALTAAASSTHPRWARLAPLSEAGNRARTAHYPGRHDQKSHGRRGGGDVWGGDSNVGVPVEDVDTYMATGPFGESRVWEATIPDGPDPVIVYRSVGDVTELASPGHAVLNKQTGKWERPGWKSYGDFVIHGTEGETTQFGTDAQEVIELGESDFYHGQIAVAIDARGMRFRTLAEPKNGRSHADVGLGLGFYGDIPWSRVVGVRDIRPGRQRELNVDTFVDLVSDANYMPTSTDEFMVDYNRRAHAAIAERAARGGHLQGHHDQKSHGRRVGARGLGDDVPPEPGVLPIPDGAVRLYHYTQEVGQADSIAEQGILRSRAKGESYGEPNQVWASSRVPDQDIKEFVEFYAYDEEMDIGRDSPTHMTVTFYGDIPPERIVAVHKPWHQSYRYILDSDITQEWIRNGNYPPENPDTGDPDADHAIQVWARQQGLLAALSRWTPHPLASTRTTSRWGRRPHLGHVLDRQTSRWAHLQGHHDQSTHGRRGGVGGYMPSSEVIEGHPELEVYDRPGGGRFIIDPAEGISTLKRDELMATMGALSDRYPGHEVTVIVAGSKGTFAKNSLGDGTYGFTINNPDGSTIYMNPNTLKKSGQDRWRRERANYSEAALMSNASTYVGTHEFGHTMQPRDTISTSGVGQAWERAFKASGQHGPGGSLYGGTDAPEAFAEAFALFTLTRGKTLDPFTLALAKDQGWVP